MKRVEHWFNDFSVWSSNLIGSYWAFIVALLVVLAWVITGPLFGFSDTWQLVINTGTTVITFLMLFLVQNTQNRDAKVMHLKLDELILAIKEADNTAIDAENLPDEKIRELEEHVKDLAKQDANVV